MPRAPWQLTKWRKAADWPPDRCHEPNGRIRGRSRSLTLTASSEPSSSTGRLLAVLLAAACLLLAPRVVLAQTTNTITYSLPDGKTFTEGAATSALRATLSSTPTSGGSWHVDTIVKEECGSSNSVGFGSLDGTPEGNISWPSGKALQDYELGYTDDNRDDSDAVLKLGGGSVHAGGTTYEGAADQITGILLRDNDPTVVSLKRVDSGAVNEGSGNTTVEFKVTLARRIRTSECTTLIPHEVIEVPFAISGTGITTDDFSLKLKAGSGQTLSSNGFKLSGSNSNPNNIDLKGATTLTPSLVFTATHDRNRGTPLIPEARVVLTITDDATDEGATETMTIALGPDGSGTNGFDRTSLATNVGGGANPHATNKSFNVQINDNDSGGPAITITGPSAVVTEGSDADFTVSASFAPTSDLGVNLSVEDADGADFIAAKDEGTKTVTIAQNTTSVSFTLETAGDSADEPSGEVSVSVANGMGYAIGKAGKATARVSDDDPITVSLQGTDANVGAEGTATFTVSLSRTLTSLEAMTVPLAVSGTATRNTDYTLSSTTCRTSNQGTGVKCVHLNSGIPVVFFTGGGQKARITLTAASTVTGSATAVIALGQIAAATSGGAAKHADDQSVTYTMALPTTRSASRSRTAEP